VETVRLGYNRSSMRKGLIMFIAVVIAALGALYFWVNR